MQEKKNVDWEFYIWQLSFKYEDIIRTFLYKQKLRKFITTRHALQEMLRAVLQVGRILESNSKPYKNVNLSSESKYINTKI